MTPPRSRAMSRTPRPPRLRTHWPLLVLAAAACGDDDYVPTPPAPPLPQATLVTASGDVAARVAEFRALLGDPANGAAAGEQPAGRREVSWDGAAANPFNNRNDFPADFFNTTARNGVVFTTDGTGFRNDSLRFAEVDASYAAEFTPFSPTKLFAAVGSRRLDVHFRVAGEATPARVQGFGVVVADVDVAGATTIEPFDAAGRSLGVFAAPVRSDAAGHSFVGVRFDAPIVARVRITAGTAPLAPGVRDVSAGGTGDVVALDNFIYGEPRAVPQG